MLVTIVKFQSILGHIRIESVISIVCSIVWTWQKTWRPVDITLTESLTLYYQQLHLTSFISIVLLLLWCSCSDVNKYYLTSYIKEIWSNCSCIIGLLYQQRRDKSANNKTSFEIESKKSFTITGIGDCSRRFRRLGDYGRQCGRGFKRNVISCCIDAV